MPLVPLIAPPIPPPIPPPVPPPILSYSSHLQNTSEPLKGEDNAVRSLIALNYLTIFCWLFLFLFYSNITFYGWMHGSEEIKFKKFFLDI